MMINSSSVLRISAYVSACLFFLTAFGRVRVGGGVSGCSHSAVRARILEPGKIVFPKRQILLLKLFTKTQIVLLFAELGSYPSGRVALIKLVNCFLEDLWWDLPHGWMAVVGK